MPEDSFKSVAELPISCERARNLAEMVHNSLGAEAAFIVHMRKPAGKLRCAECGRAAFRRTNFCRAAVDFVPRRCASA